MIIQTLFHHEGRFSIGEVEVRLLPGIPLLHVVGQPDAQIRECGIKLKSALRALGLKWPEGHQIVVNLRPSHFRKTSAGVELAVALGVLQATGQLAPEVAARLAQAVVYGELGLDGQVLAPHDLAAALRFVGERLLSGVVGEALAPEGASVREGQWFSLGRLDQREPVRERREFDWSKFWQSPPYPSEREFHARAAESLWLAAQAGLNVLVAGPQGSGKSTWAEALYALTPPPSPRARGEVEDLFGPASVAGLRWRPFERPHHSVTVLAMIGGGSPLVPGVISRAHGGVLVMDEFLEFDSRVLEALREPVESGWVEHARRRERLKFPADFQLIATTNLCPCGKLNPEPSVGRACSHSLTRCRSVCARLSGPVLDRFDLLVMSHAWVGKGRRVSFAEIQREVEQTRTFTATVNRPSARLPSWVSDLPLSFRRRRSLLRVARALADREGVAEIRETHFRTAYAWAEEPMGYLSQLFA